MNIIRFKGLSQSVGFEPRQQSKTRFVILQVDTRIELTVLNLTRYLKH